VFPWNIAGSIDLLKASNKVDLNILSVWASLVGLSLILSIVFSKPSTKIPLGLIPTPVPII